MSTPSCYLGVDVSKETLVVACGRHRWQLANTKEGHRQFIAKIKKLPSPGQVVCESTGSYHLRLCLALQAAGVAFTVANPAQIRYFGRSEAINAKNDPLDAQLIERFAQARQLAADPPLCPEQLALQESVTHRQQIVDMLKVLKTYRQQALSQTALTEIDKSMAVFEKRLEALESKLRAQIAAHPVWKKKFALLTATAGVGFITALQLLARMPELGTLNRGQCAALAGVAPYDEDSGQHVGKRSIRGGRREVRCALYMAALTATNHNPVLKTFYQHLIAQKKAFKVALIAVMRKLLIHLNTVLKNAAAPTPVTAS